jgi:DNA-binding CsgD family transcriptional regulator
MAEVRPVRALESARPVGRRAEVGLALARVREAAEGRSGVLLVRGIEGVGKSALLSLLCESVRVEAEVLSTVCADAEARFAVARSLFGALPADAHDERILQQLVVWLGVERVLARPLVLVLDDANRCDIATARLLGLLARRATSGWLFVVLAYPCGERAAAEELFAELTGVLDTTAVDLAPLPEADVRELIHREFGVVPHEEFLRVCVELCNGNPRATLACLARIAEQGGGPDEGWAERLRVEATAESVAGWSSWLARQDEPVRRFALAVALLGDGEAEAAGALFELPAFAVRAARTGLRLAGLITESGALRSEPLRRHLLAALDARELTALRVRAARLLSDEGRPPGEVAEQIAALPVVDEPWMVAVLREAARDCSDRPEVAAGYLRRVLEVAPDTATRLELAKVLAEFDKEAASALYTEALAALTDVEVQASASVKFAGVAVYTERVNRAFDALVDAWRALPLTADPDLRLPVEVILLLMGQADIATVAAALDCGREIVPPVEPATQPVKHLVQQLARGELMRGESLSRTLSLARSAPTPPAAPHNWWDVIAAWTLHFCGDPVEAAAVLDRVLASAQVGGDGFSEVVALGVRAMVRVELGELAGAASDAETALTHPMAEQGNGGTRYPHTALAAVCAGQGDIERAQRLLTTDPREPVTYGVAMTTRARIMRNSGQPTRALELLLRCGEELGAMGIGNLMLVPWWLDAVVLSFELGRTAEAFDLAERGADAAARWDTAAARGHATLASGLVTGDIEMLEAAADRLSAAGHRLRETQALTALGTALLRHGDDRGGRKQLRAAVDLAVRCGAAEMAGAARTALVLAGGRMGELATRDVLTTGERRVAELAARGLSNRQIADSLFVTVRTVESHLSNAYRKLRVTTRADLAARLR